MQPEHPRNDSTSGWYRYAILANVTSVANAVMSHHKHASTMAMQPMPWKAKHGYGDMGTQSGFHDTQGVVGPGSVALGNRSAGFWGQ